MTAQMMVPKYAKHFNLNSGPISYQSMSSGFKENLNLPYGSFSTGEWFGSVLAEPTFWYLASYPGRTLTSSLILIGLEFASFFTLSQNESSSSN
jgi:hypothetical protein